MDEKNGKIAHQRIVAGRRILRNLGRNNNSPATPVLTKKLEGLIQSPGFTGKAPGGLSRWSTKRSMEWQPLQLRLVAEVQFDHFTGGRFRHGTKFLRWRPDKSPKSCTMKQVQRENKSVLNLL